MSDPRLLTKERMERLRVVVGALDGTPNILELLDHIDAQAELNAEMLQVLKGIAYEDGRKVTSGNDVYLINQAKMDAVTAIIAKAEGR